MSSNAWGELLFRLRREIARLSRVTSLMVLPVVAGCLYLPKRVPPTSARADSLRRPTLPRYPVLVWSSGPLVLAEWSVESAGATCRVEAVSGILVDRWRDSALLREIRVRRTARHPADCSLDASIWKVTAQRQLTYQVLVPPGSPEAEAAAEQHRRALLIALIVASPMIYVSLRFLALFTGMPR